MATADSQALVSATRTIPIVFTAVADQSGKTLSNLKTGTQCLTGLS
ncbi:hypothetical protein OK016_03255 [Vibrio chagasii]|nr:hypothetical protein [Vibrio chagasii]